MEKSQCICLSTAFGFSCTQCRDVALYQKYKAPGDNMSDYDYECRMGDMCPLEPCKKSQVASASYMELARKWFIPDRYDTESTDHILQHKPKRKRDRSAYMKKYNSNRYQEMIANRNIPIPNEGLLSVNVVGDDYVCPYCGLIGGNELMVKEHLEENHGDDIYLICGIDKCGAPLKYYRNYVRHVIKYHKLKFKSELYECPECDSSYASTLCLEIHMARRHRGQASHSACDICGKVLWKDTLEKHVAFTHMLPSEWKYVCSYSQCGKRFPDYTSAYRHEKHIHHMWA